MVLSGGYICQQCKGPAIRFLVRRKQMKLCIAGRDPIEALPVNPVIPKAYSKYIGSAMI